MPSFWSAAALPVLTIRSPDVLGDSGAGDDVGQGVPVLVGRIALGGLVGDGLRLLGPEQAGDVGDEFRTAAG